MNWTALGVWVGALAITAAVIVALFAPGWRQARDNRRYRRMVIALAGLIGRATRGTAEAAGAHRHPGSDDQDQEGYEFDLESLIASGERIELDRLGSAQALKAFSRLMAAAADLWFQVSEHKKLAHPDPLDADRLAGAANLAIQRVEQAVADLRQALED